MKNFSTSALLLLLFVFSSCGSAKMAELHKQHQSKLNALTNQSMDISETVDGLAEVFVGLFEESLSYNSSRKTIKHISSFTKQNKSLLSTIIKDLEKQQANLSFEDKAGFLLGLTSKPYVSKLINLVPQLEKKIDRKISSFDFIGDAMGLFSPKSMLDSFLK